MKAVKARITKGLPHRAVVLACDNSGARLMRIVSVINCKTVKGRKPSAGVGDKVMCSVIQGKPDMRKQVVSAVIVRQKMPYKRRNGMHIKFEDNAAVIIKDDLGNPKGTLIKGPIAKEASERWPLVSKIASSIV
ncbi:50S ribosomal protein L14 [Candidatus Woesearchaeota archaeon CG10_big_fil_rev_8_21_14_0_10_37_12]|nr:MAG: 50S ribosomal protein L14 [Candidatus Woesearchaeota archaeon CG10_big_fil_rev_8_21_14_0_10_37_12]